MAKLFLRTTRKSGIAKLYTRVQRNGLNMIVCTGVTVSIELRGLRFIFDATDLLQQLEERLTSQPADLIIMIYTMVISTKVIK